MGGILKKFFTGNPLGSITIGSILTTVGMYVYSHFDPTKLTATGLAVFGVVSTVVGALTHHSLTAAGKGSGT